MICQPASQRKLRAKRFVFACGAATLVCGDALALLADVRGASAVLTDPPFGQTDCRWDLAPDLARLEQLLAAATSDSATWALFAIQPFATALITAWRARFRYDIIWSKRRTVGFLNANRQPLRSHEHILVFCRRPSAALYQAQKTPGRPYPPGKGKTHKTPLYGSPALQLGNSTGERHPRSVLNFDEPNRGKIHPTQKPLALMEWLVRTYTRPGDLVLDPFAGSATTAVACLNTDRRFYGCEKNPAHFAAACQRLKAAEAARRRGQAS